MVNIQSAQTGWGNIGGILANTVSGAASGALIGSGLGLGVVVGGSALAGAGANMAGQLFDNRNSGGGFNRARYYNPTLQRFVSEDPIGLSGGLNRFAYVGGNPVSFTDPEGLQHDARPRRPGWPEWAQPTQPNRNCVTAECVAGLLPAPIENRSNEQISLDLNWRICKWSCEKAVSTLTGGTADICRIPFPVKYGATTGSKQVCKMVCE